MNYLAVFLGGGLGSICRYGIAQWMSTWNPTFPHATLLANVLSCIVLGFFAFYFTKNIPHEAVRSLVLIGFCGGFSTFSTFTGETFRLVEGGNISLVLAHVIGNLVLCMVALYVGGVLALKV